MGQKMEANFPNSPLKLPSLSSSLKRKRPPMIAIPTVLQEISSQTPKFRDPLTAGDGGVISSSGLGVCVSAVKGKKKFMEDSHKIVSWLNGCSRNGFFGVYDGHGGKKAAEFAAENLHSNIMAIMEDCGDDFTAKEEAVKAGYLKTDQQFLEQGLLSGACCVTALIKGEDIVVSNLGDCRAVLCRGGVAEALTTDHRAEREDERERIENEGGYVEIHRGAWRVHGILSVSRSIGDAHLKQWVSAEPDTKIMQLKPDMDYLVLASDGLWEVVGNQEAIDIVTKLCMPEKKAGGLLGENEIEFGRVNVSPSSKLRRVSLVKQQQTLQKQSPPKKTTENCSKDDGFPTENDAPPLKSRRINLVKKINTKIESPDKENTKIIASELASASKELVNLAVSRGSLDDVTVMIIDLSYFRSKQAI
ncbi:Probable protein phosphatase 2C 14 [Linum perenne]